MKQELDDGHCKCFDQANFENRAPDDRTNSEEQTSSLPISFKLPPAEALSGHVLKHACGQLETLFRKHSPLIFKIGVTHDHVFRWTNETYGYQYAREKWAHMLVLWISNEPSGPCMLEAALIDKYKSSSALTYISLLSTGSLSFQMSPRKLSGSNTLQLNHQFNTNGFCTA